MDIKKIIEKYLFLIIPVLILLSNGLMLKSIDRDYVPLSGNTTAFYLMIVLVLSPLVSLIIETIGLVRAVISFRKTDQEAPYPIKRKGIRYVSLFVGAILMTLLWFCSILSISYPYLIGQRAL